jgi:glutamate formiminotransferase/glutamate formiminotransferase/formiminotetrahydrofolate cyclodeaminase
MDRIVECVPNFSEGRKDPTIEALMAAIRSVSGVVLLDRQSDADHNRTVLTFVGTPEASAEAAFAAAREALDRIDLTTHRGEHPRVGATDVIPFVPIRGVTMDDCVQLARQVGHRIADELRIPVFLYEQAATAPFRARIEDIRREGLEGLADRMRLDPNWAPDFGDAKLHRTAGATIVGARRPLIAYNVNLSSTDFNIARVISQTVRESTGGLRAVKAVGIALKSRGMVQVSMNLTNYEETPVYVAFEAVKREAQRHGVEVHSSEVIGLIPEAAVVQVAGHFLQLEKFETDQVLEARMAKALTQDLSAMISPFLEAVSGPMPGPGGASVAAMAAAASVSLGVMVSGILAHDEQDPITKEALQNQRKTLMQLRDNLQAAVREDAEAYGAVLKAYKRSKVDPNRSAAIQQAMTAAIAVPLAILQWSVEGFEALRQLAPRAPDHLTTDLNVGASLLGAAAHSAITVIRTNAETLKNDPRVPDLLKSLGQFEERLGTSAA